METKTIKQMQHEHLIWVKANFPESLKNPWQGLVGIVEEAVGEIAEIDPKLLANDRSAFASYIELMSDDIEPMGVEFNRPHVNKFIDACGDTFIYMMSFCNAMGWDLETIIRDVDEDDGEKEYSLNYYVGKLSHHFLKMTQGIRGSVEEHEKKIQHYLKCIFQSMYTTLLNEDLVDIYVVCEKTWDYVKTRNWVADPVKGGIESNV